MPGASASSPSAKSGGTDEQVELGYVAGVHGVRGHVKVKLHASTSEALVPGVQLVFRVRGGGPVSQRAQLAELFAGRGASGEVRLRLEGVESREQAEALKSHGVWIERADLPALEADEYYFHDLIGLDARHALVDLELGRVIGVTSNGPQDLIELSWRSPSGRSHKWLCPALPGIVVEASADALCLDPVEGHMPEELEALFAAAFAALEEHA